MNIKDIITKLLAGTALTDDEKSFAEGFDLQALTDKASASARRKAEGERDTAKAEIETLKAKLAELEDNKGKGETELQKLQKQVATLTKAKAESDAKIAAQVRKDAIANAAKAAGVSVAEGFSVAAFELLLDKAVGDTDVTDADAMTAVLTQFKQDNPAMIADAGKTGIGAKGKPSSGYSFQGNPFKKGEENLTAQMQLISSNPAEAKRLAAAEGVTLDC